MAGFSALNNKCAAGTQAVRNIVFLGGRGLWGLTWVVRGVLAIVLFRFALVVGCAHRTPPPSSQAEFRRDMQQRYEATCDHYFSIYASSDRDGAKKALGQIIDLSLSEKGKARHYWRFNLL